MNPGHGSYTELVRDLSTLIEQGRRLAVRQVNVALIATYWLMGRRIAEYELKGERRAVYGETLLSNISARLVPRFGRGFMLRNLRYMRQFYLAYPKIVNTVCSQSRYRETSVRASFRALSDKFPLSWSHYRCLMRIGDDNVRKFYERECTGGHWSVRQLDRQIQSMLYERSALSKRKEAVVAKAHENQRIVRPEDEIKDPYILEFLSLKDEYSETQLEDALIRHLEQFLLELGLGFTFVARQKRFVVGGNHYRIDLLLYHRVLRCLFLIDLKIGHLSHADIGQMNFYLNWAKDKAKLSGENDPVGAILCSGKDKVYVKYATGGLSNKIFVSQYKVGLPKAQDLEAELRKGRQRFLEYESQRDEKVLVQSK